MSERMKKNIWADRFGQLLEGQELTRRLKKRPDVIKGLGQSPTPTACDLLDDHLRRIRVTSGQEVELLRELLGRCQGHALRYYGSTKDFTESVHARDLRLSEDPRTHMLTSEPGLGKSELMKALQEVLGAPLEIQVSTHLPPQRFVGVVRVCIEGITKVADLLNALAEQAGIPAEYRSGDKAAIANLRRQLYRAGVMLIVVDEMQFLASSASAHATIARTLHLLRQLGIPLVFVGNYSLGHKLQRRPPEEQERILAEPLILLADGPTDASFIELLEESVRLLDGALTIAPAADAPMIHWYTGGNRRAWRKLLVIAYGLTRKAVGDKAALSIGMADLQAAYSNGKFQVFRTEVVAYRLQLLDGRMVKQDLWCPFELPAPLMARRAMHAKQMKDLEIRNAALVDSMLPEERAGLEVVLSERAPSAPGLAAPAKPARRRVPKPTLKELQASYPKTRKRA